MISCEKIGRLEDQDKRGTVKLPNGEYLNTGREGGIGDHLQSQNSFQTSRLSNPILNLVGDCLILALQLE
jgi:hypothetical protein